MFKRILYKTLIVFLLILFIISNIKISCGMSYEEGELPLPPSNSTPTPAPTPSKPDAPNDNQTEECKHYSVRGFSGNVQEAIDSVSDTTIGKGSLSAKDVRY